MQHGNSTPDQQGLFLNLLPPLCFLSHKLHSWVCRELLHFHLTRRQQVQHSHALTDEKKLAAGKIISASKSNSGYHGKQVGFF